MNGFTLQLSPSQRDALMALIAGYSLVDFAEVANRKIKAIQKDVERARIRNGMTTFQMVAQLALELNGRTKAT